MSITNIEHILQKEFSYYRSLSYSDRKIFISRVKKFVNSKSFEGRKELIVTDEMKILIAATAIQLTFGFPRYYNYDYFDRIILYPEKYYSAHTGKMHTGEMNTGGILVFSWKDFYDGIKTDNDSRNVGIHEFAHALDYIDKAHLGVEKYFAYTIEKIKSFGKYYKHCSPEKLFFKSYAITNEMEFFAVGAEYFFESPNELRSLIPDLYNTYCIALNQTPLPKVNLSERMDNEIIKVNGKDRFSNFQKKSFFSLCIFLFLQITFWTSINTHIDSNDENFFYVMVFSYIMLTFLLFIYFLAHIFRPNVVFYNKYLRINFSFARSFVNTLFFVKHKSYRYIPIENVISISVSKDVYYEKISDTNYYKISCIYIYNDKIRYVSYLESDVAKYNLLFQYYFTQYKVALFV